MFRNRFLKTVGLRSDLDAREKFQYLIPQLDGEPLCIANGYFITDDSYYNCLDCLEDRYGNTAGLVTALALEFVLLRDVDQTSKDLQRFHEEALCLVDEMEQLGQDANGNTILRQFLLFLTCKLTTYVRVTEVVVFSSNCK
ncbi:hypothetical protein AAVH_23108 [Aphelenchoides avenae]|nr:hypothetical protein AAVH_23108 [Aphelenchus avenae]